MHYRTLSSQIHRRRNDWRHGLETLQRCHAEFKELMEERKAAKRRQLRNAESKDETTDEEGPKKAELLKHGRLDIIEWDFDFDDAPASVAPQFLRPVLSSTIEFPTGKVPTSEPKREAATESRRTGKKTTLPSDAFASLRKHAILRAWNVSWKKKLSRSRKHHSPPSPPLPSPSTSTSTPRVLMAKDQNIPRVFTSSKHCNSPNEGEDTLPPRSLSPDSAITPVRHGRPRARAVNGNRPELHVSL